FAPEIVGLFLRFRGDGKRNRFREFEHRSAVQRDERLPFELKIHDHHGSSHAARSALRISLHIENLRVLEDRAVKLRSFLSLRIEPQKRFDLCNHDFSLSARVGGLPFYFSLDRYALTSGHRSDTTCRAGQG